MEHIKTLKDIDNITVDPGRKLFSATHEEIMEGKTTDVYFLRTLDILSHGGNFCKGTGHICRDP